MKKENKKNKLLFWLTEFDVPISIEHNMMNDECISTKTNQQEQNRMNDEEKKKGFILIK